MNRWGSVLLVAAMAAAPITANAVDVGAFVRKDKFEDIKLSPNGDYLAATVLQEDRTTLAIIRRSDNTVVSGLSLGENNYVHEFTWVNPERVVVSVAQKFGALDEPQLTGELYAVGVTGHPENLVGYRTQGNAGTKIKMKKAEYVAAFMVDDLPANDRKVVVSVMPLASDPYMRAEMLDVYNGQRTRITTVPVRRASFTTDNSGVVRFAAGANSDNSIKLYYRKGDGADWKLINDEDETRIVETPIGFSADNRIAYLRAQKEGGPDVIVAYDTTSDSRTEILRDEVADPGAIIYGSKGNVPIGVVFKDGKPRTAFFDEKTPEARLHRSLEASFPGNVVQVTSNTSDGKLSLLEVWSDRNPGDFYVFNNETKKADYLLSRGDWFDPKKLSEQRPIQLAARDGLMLRGFLTTPLGSSGKNIPMVVLPHGGPFGIQDVWGFNTHTQMLASAGYAVLQVNFRGSGGFGRDFHEAGARQWGKSMQDDLTDATRWAIDQGIADSKRICIYGNSYGAYAALMGVAKEPSLYRCAVGYVGVYDLPMLHTTGDIQERDSGETYLKEWVGQPDKLAEVSPSRLADRIKVPVFLAAGGEDERAPIEHSRKMEKALKASGVPVETLYFDTEGHGFYKEEHNREYYTKLLAFFARHLGGTAPAGATASDSASK